MRMIENQHVVPTSATRHFVMTAELWLIIRQTLDCHDEVSCLPAPPSIANIRGWDDLTGTCFVADSQCWTAVPCRPAPPGCLKQTMWCNTAERSNGNTQRDQPGEQGRHWLGLVYQEATFNCSPAGSDIMWVGAGAAGYLQIIKNIFLIPQIFI